MKLLSVKTTVYRFRLLQGLTYIEYTNNQPPLSERGLYASECLDVFMGDMLQGGCLAQVRGG